MGRRRKKYKKMIRKRRRIPTVFQCPACGSRNLTIRFEKKTSGEEGFGAGGKIAIIRCGKCGLCYRLRVPNIYEAVDAYNKFIDLFTENKLDELEECSGTEQEESRVLQEEQ